MAQETRRADKTGLIAWKANKYSVPMAWQQARVGVLESGGQLHISDLNTGEVIASHALCADKGKVIKNTHHYRDHAKRVPPSKINDLVGVKSGIGCANSSSVPNPRSTRISWWLPRPAQAPCACGSGVDPTLAERRGMTATRLQSYLEAAQAAVLRERQPEPLPEPKEALDLSAYRRVGHSSGQGVTHEPA